MATQTFELVSPFVSIYTPSLKWNGASNLLLGQTVNHLLPGEFLIHDSNYGVNRETAGADTDLSVKPSFVFYSEPGRGDIITGGKLPILQFGPYEADTSIVLRAAGGALDGDLVVGAAVAVRNVQNPTNFDVAAFPLRGLAAFDHADDANQGVFKVGYISRIIGTGLKARVRVLVGI